MKKNFDNRIDDYRVEEVMGKPLTNGKVLEPEQLDSMLRCIYVSAWNDQFVTIESGVRKLWTDDTIMTIMRAAIHAGFSLTRSMAGNILGKLMRASLIQIERGRNRDKPAFIICFLVDPRNISGTSIYHGTPEAEDSPKPTEKPQKTKSKSDAGLRRSPVSIPRVYRFLFGHKRTRENGTDHYLAGGRDDVLKILKNKWPRRDVDSPLMRIEGCRWVEFRGEGRDCKCHFLLDPQTMPSNVPLLPTGEVIAEEPPIEFNVASAGMSREEDKMKTGEARGEELSREQATSAEVPVTEYEAEPKAESISEMSEESAAVIPYRTNEGAESARRTHGRLAAFMTVFENSIWRKILTRTNEQPRGEWDAKSTRVFRLVDFFSFVLSSEESELLETIGRMCVAGLLKPVEHNAWVVDWNPMDVKVEVISDRKIILPSGERSYQIAVVRRLAKEMSRESGEFSMSQLAKRAARELNLVRPAIYTYFVGYDEKKSRIRFGLIMPDKRGDDHLLAPVPFSGCDFFASSSTKHSVYPRKDTPAWKEAKAELQRRYIAAAEFNGTRSESSASKVAVPTVIEERPHASEAKIPFAIDEPVSSLFMQNVMSKLTELEQESLDARALSAELRNRGAELRAQAVECDHAAEKQDAEARLAESKLEEIRALLI